MNHTGTLNGIASGQTAAFDIEFVGDGRPHRFDLQFVREGTNVVLGSIPVVIGTPVVGEGYQYDELEDGEIHHSSHFGHYIANTAPSFTGGVGQTVDEDAGAQAIAGWATNIAAGPASEAGQQVNFIVTSDNPALFSVQPTIAADGTLTFTPAPNAFGIANVTVQLHDNGGTGIGGSDTSVPQTFTIEINAVNDAPVANADNYLTPQGSVFTTADLLANDTDAEGEALTATLATPAAHGTVILLADGSFTYTPNAGYSGSDQFSYTVSDGQAASGAATVTIEVIPNNQAPVSVDDLLAGTEDTALSISAGTILANDADPDGDALTISLISPPQHGTLHQNADGSFLYTPAANFSGSDSFQYQLSDGQASSNLATITINIAAINDFPVAFGDSFDATEDATLSVTLPGILANDTDLDGDVLRSVLVTGPSHGTLTLNPNGTFTYIPQLNFNGVDGFTYKANDGLADSNVAAVRLVVASVNDAPVAASENFSTDQNAPLVVAPRGVLNNDTDVEGDALAAVLATGPAHGTVTLNADGSFTYTPTAGYSGTDSFAYRVSDGVALSNLATSIITVVPFVPATKFFVVDATALSSYKYAADGSALSNLALTRADAKPRGIASNAAGTVQWVIDNGGDVFVYDYNGALLGQWTPRNVGKPEGIAVWGSDLWIVDPTQDRVFKFTGGANLRNGRVDATSSFALNSGNLNATDIVTDGVHLWVTNDTTTDKVFRYTTSGTLEGSWTLPTTNANPTGITLDPANVNHLWIVDAGTDRVYQYDGATARLSGSQAASVSFGLATGNSNPQGIADPLPAARQLAVDSTVAVSLPNKTSAHSERPSFKLQRAIPTNTTSVREFEPVLELKHEDLMASTTLAIENAIHQKSDLPNIWDTALLNWLSEDKPFCPFKAK